MGRRAHYFGANTIIRCDPVGHEAKASKPAKKPVELRNLVNPRLAKYQVRQKALRRLLKEHNDLLIKTVSLKSSLETRELRECVARFLVLGRDQNEAVATLAGRLTARMIEDVVFSARLLIRQSRQR